MGCALSKINKVSPAEMTPCERRGRLTNFKLWVGKKRLALLKQKVRKNQVMPFNQSSDECYPTSPDSTCTGQSLCHTTTSLSSSSSRSTTISGLSDVSDPNNNQTAEPAIQDRCRTRIIKKGSGSYHSDKDLSESSEETYHGNFESRDTSPMLFSSDTESPTNYSTPNNHHESHIWTPTERLDDTSLLKMIAAKEGGEVDDKEAEHLMRFAEAEVEEMKERRRRHLDWDSDDDDDDDNERTVNLDGILTVRPIRPPTQTHRQVAGRDEGKAVAVAAGPVEEDREPKYANSTEELEAVINQTFETYDLKMPEEEWKLEEKTYDDPDEELTDVIRQIFKRWDIKMPDEEVDVPSTSRIVGNISQPSTSASRDVSATTALAHQMPSTSGWRPSATEARQFSRNHQPRPRAAHGARTDPTGSGFELPASAFHRKF